MEMLDNTLTDFATNAPKQFEKAIYSAQMERSVGLGVMGFHSFLQKESVAMDSEQAMVYNRIIFQHIHEKVEEADRYLAERRGPCPDAVNATRISGKDFNKRFSYRTAIAPTASISILCGESSPGIEPYAANCYKLVTLSGAHIVKNKNLKVLLNKYNKNTEEIWMSILQNNGSVSHLDFLSDHEKNVYKTAMEMDQERLIRLAANRVDLVDQSTSLNIFLPSNVSKKMLHNIHFSAWKMGIKTLYYCRSTTAQNAMNIPNRLIDTTECQSCQ